MVTLLTSTSSQVAGKAVSLQASSGTVVIGSPSPALTGPNGQVTFTVTDSVAESVTLTAKDTTDNLPLTSMPTVMFPTASPSATASNVDRRRNDRSGRWRDQTLISVTVTDQFGNPLKDKTVTIQGVPSTDVQTHPITTGSSLPGITDSTGIAEFEASDSKAESVTFTATDTTDGNLVLAKTVSITFVPGPPDPTALGTTVAVAPRILRPMGRRRRRSRSP